MGAKKNPGGKKKFPTAQNFQKKIPGIENSYRETLKKIPGAENSHEKKFLVPKISRKILEVEIHMKKLQE